MNIFTKTLGTKEEPVIIWAHGWGQSHAAFLPLAESLQMMGRHILIDLPGFGATLKPETDWDTEEYADAVAVWMKEHGLSGVIWGGHSFGCRVGIRLAAKYPELVRGLALIAGAGLKRKRPWYKQLYFKGRIYTFKLLKKLIPFGLNESWLRSKFGSRDYNNAGEMRGIFIKTISEDLSDVAAEVSCPVLLVYGSDDEETPAEYGQRYARIMKRAELFVLDGQDHYSVLSTGRHQVAPLIQNFIKQNAS